MISNTILCNYFWDTKYFQVLDGPFIIIYYLVVSVLNKSTLYDKKLFYRTNGVSLTVPIRCSD